MDLNIRATVVALDAATLSLDEVPVSQYRVNDSRSHIMGTAAKVGDATGAGLAQTGPSSKVASFNRGDLVLDPDEAVFLNSVDIAGGPSINGDVNIWYED